MKVYYEGILLLCIFWQITQTISVKSKKNCEDSGRFGAVEVNGEYMTATNLDNLKPVIPSGLSLRTLVIRFFINGNFIVHKDQRKIFFRFPWLKEAKGGKIKS